MQAAAKPTLRVEKTVARTLKEIVAKRVELLTAYQDKAYADRYSRFIERVSVVEKERARGRSGLAEAVAKSLYKLMAYKDEYEVARLYTDGEFLKKLGAQFEGDYKLSFHLAPPLFADRDPTTRRAQEARIRRLDADRVPLARRASSGCAAPRSTSSATPRSARWSAA